MACPITISPDEFITSTTGLQEVGAAITAKTFLAIIAFSQSIAGNHHQGLYQPTQDVRMVDVCGNGKVYRHREPMLGTTFTPNGYAEWNDGYGSYFGKLGDLLIEGGKYDRVIWVQASYAGAGIADFILDGRFGYRMPAALDALRSLGISPGRITAFIMNEGETDGLVETSHVDYARMAREGFTLTTILGFGGRWIVTRESYAYGLTSQRIRAAQAALATDPRAIQGPDFDTLGIEYRYQEEVGPGNRYVHFNAAGRDRAAEMMRDTIYARLPR
jgi:hypothetical protein